MCLSISSYASANLLMHASTTLHPITGALADEEAEPGASQGTEDGDYEEEEEEATAKTPRKRRAPAAGGGGGGRKSKATIGAEVASALASQVGLHGHALTCMPLLCALWEWLWKVGPVLNWCGKTWAGEDRTGASPAPCVTCRPPSMGTSPSMTCTPTPSETCVKSFSAGLPFASCVRQPV